MKLVLLPGMDGTGDLFARFTPHLPADIEPVVIRYPNEAWGYERLSPFVLEQLPVNEPFTLLGESFSGPLALSIAAKNPPQLKALILVCTFASNPKPWPISLVLKMHFLPPTLFQRLAIRYGLVHGLSSPSLENEVFAAVQSLSPATIWARLQAIADVNELEASRDIKCPVLYLSARQDRLIPLRCVHDLTERIKRLQVIDLEGPHCLLQSNPVCCAKEIASFVKRAFA